MTSYFSGLFYFSFGCVFLAYLYILFSKKRESKETKTASKDSSIKRVYLNIFFQDRKECIRNIVRSKISKNRPVIRALAKRAAVALLEKGIVERVANNLCEAIPGRIALLGVNGTATIAYTQSAYACIEVTLNSLDLYQFLKFNAGVDIADKFTGFLELYGLPAMTDALKSFILNFLAGKFLVALPATLKEKLYNKMSAEVEIIACAEEEQGPFIVQTIAHLNDGGSVNMKNNPNQHPNNDDD
jgi:hypothetical protein